MKISIGNDPTGWYHSTVTTFDARHDDVSTVHFRLFFWDLFLNGHTAGRAGDWKLLRWGDLSIMHGRRIHISAVVEEFITSISDVPRMKKATANASACLEAQ